VKEIFKIIIYKKELFLSQSPPLVTIGTVWCLQIMLYLTREKTAAQREFINQIIAF